MNANRIVTGLNSDIGLRRASNQDNALAGHGIFVVCDGMGGGMGGERASEAVVRHCAQLGTKAARNRHDIEETLNAAQREVLALGESLGGIAGTTISGVIMPADIDGMTAHAADANSTADGNDSCYIVNIGDSRTYHMCATEDGGWDASTFTRITRDHSERRTASHPITTRRMPSDVSSSARTACMPKWTRNVSPPSRPPTTILRPPPTHWSKRRCGPVATTT